MQQSDFYRIHITPDLKPTVMERGELDENGNKRGSTIQVEVQPPEQWLPNYYEHAVKKQVNEKGIYEGKFKFCSISEPGAEMIEIRYLSACPSLDLKYQDEKKYEALTEIDQIGWEYRGNYIIEFKLAETSPLLLDFFKHAPYNGTYEHRDVNTRVLFVELDGTKSVSKKKDQFKIEKILFECKQNLIDNDDYAEVVSEILDVQKGYDLDTRRDVLTDMLAKEGVGFIKRIDKVKEKIKNQTEYLFKDGVISVLENKIISNETKKEVHPLKFKSDKPSEVSEQLSEYSMKNKKNFLEWKEVEKQLLQLT